MLSFTVPIHISVTVVESNVTIDKSQVREIEEYFTYKTKEGEEVVIVVQTSHF